MNRTNEAAFEIVMETHLLQNGYTPIARESFATERTIALIKERRAALITAAVTGQLDLQAAA